MRNTISRFPVRDRLLPPAFVLSLVVAFLFSAPIVRADAASPTVTAAVGLPGVGAPSGTTFDLSTVGYQAAEFFLEGNASSYQPVAGTPFLADGVWTIEADAAQQPYKTRIQVYRPANPKRFNGTVFVEWLNATNQSDSMPDWLMAHNEIIRRGSLAAPSPESRQSASAESSRTAASLRL